MSPSIHLKVRLEDGALWATVDEHPGVFATGDTPEELRSSLEEAISLYLSDRARNVAVTLSPLVSEPVQVRAHAVIRGGA